MINKILHSLEKTSISIGNKRTGKSTKLVWSAKVKGLAASSYQGIST